MVDPFPTGMVEEAAGLFSLPGNRERIYIRPLANECSVCKRLPKSKWCRHLISAGIKMNIDMTSKKQAKVSLSKLDRHQKPDKAPSGRKKPRARDYREVDLGEEEQEEQEEQGEQGEQLPHGEEEEEEPPLPGGQAVSARRSPLGSPHLLNPTCEQCGGLFTPLLLQLHRPTCR